jgi:arylsulfatase A-like enzyme
MPDDRPHILLITTDQLRKDALSCYGATAIQTPCIDSIASEGVRFERAYTVSPWCLPSRCSILTGMFPHRHRAYSNFRNARLSTELPNLYTELKRGGYRIAHIGKCHYAPVPYGLPKPDHTLPYDEFRNYYLSLGIDHLDLQDDKQVSVWFCDDYSKELDAAGYLMAYRDAVWDRSSRKVFTFPAPAEWHPDRWVGDKAARYIEQRDAASRQFVWASFSGPHFPFDPPAEYLDRVDMSEVGVGTRYAGEFDDPARIHHADFHGPKSFMEAGVCRDFDDDYWLALRRNYFANVAMIDDQVGRVLEAARARFGENLLVFFTADHGEMLGNHQLWGKHACGYEDVLNVPLLMRGPGASKGRRCDEKVMLIDLLPTCLEAAGLKPSGRIDGRSLSDSIASGGHELVFSEGEGFVTVSDGRYKLVRVRRDGRRYSELFDLERDPGEACPMTMEGVGAEIPARLGAAMIDLFMDDLLG